jgi:hypothetical protein
MTTKIQIQKKERPILCWCVLLAGTIIGLLGYQYADHPANGPYQVGLSEIEEIFVICLFTFAALRSLEPISIFLLQIIAAWHLASWWFTSL